MVAVPKKSGFGSNLILWLGLVASRSLANGAVGSPNSLKVVPSRVNFHLPLVSSTNVTATPGAAPTANGASSLMSVAAAALSKVDMASPLLVTLSSSITVKLSLAMKLLPLGLEKKPPTVVKTGASFIAVILISKVLEPVLSLGDTPLPLSTTSVVTVAVPLALALGVKVRVPLGAMVGCTSTVSYTH